MTSPHKQQNHVVIAKFKCSQIARNQFSQSKCILPISIGQNYHEADKLKATLRLVNKNFKECAIIICDALQKYSLSILYNIDEETALKIAIEQGNNWLKTNNNYLQKLSTPNSVTRWQEHLTKKGFLAKNKIITHLYKNNKNIKFAFDKTINGYLKRIKKNLGINYENNTNDAFKTCLAYLIEENAVMAEWLTPDAFELYPQKRPLSAISVFNYFHQNHEHYEDKLIRLKFIKKKIITTEMV